MPERKRLISGDVFLKSLNKIFWDTLYFIYLDHQIMEKVGFRKNLKIQLHNAILAFLRTWQLWKWYFIQETLSIIENEHETHMTHSMRPIGKSILKTYWDHTSPLLYSSSKRSYSTIFSNLNTQFSFRTYFVSWSFQLSIVFIFLRWRERHCPLLCHWCFGFPSNLGNC